MSGPQFRSRPAISYPISCHSFSLKVSFRLNFSFPFFMSKNVCPCKQNVCNFKSCQNQFCMYDINRVMYKLYHPQIYILIGCGKKIHCYKLWYAPLYLPSHSAFWFQGFTTQLSIVVFYLSRLKRQLLHIQSIN